MTPRANPTRSEGNPTTNQRKNRNVMGIAYLLLGAALAAEPPKPTPTAPDRRRQFRVIEGRKS
jgi:hypothetical protein